MKSYVVFFIFLISYSCGLHKNMHKNTIAEKIIFTDSNDTIILKQDSMYTEFYTIRYLSEYEKFNAKENRSAITRAVEYKIDLSPQTLKMIDEDGGMVNVLKNILSEKNYAKFERRIPLTLTTIFSLANSTVTEYKISIFTKNIYGFDLTNKEIIELLDYCKKIQFVYKGNEFKNEKIPFGYTFGGLK